MKIVVNKVIPKEIEYKAGDIISLGDPHKEIHYLLIEGSKGEVGAINLLANELEYFYPQVHNFDTVISDILKENVWDEWALIKSEDVTMTLNCKDGAMEQRNNSGSF